MIEKGGRPFSSVEEMDRELLRRWNERVSPEDLVWILGDVVFGSLRQQKAVLSQLNGQKRLIVGSHDYHPEFLKECGFLDYTACEAVTIAGARVYLVHEPPPFHEPIPLDCRFCLHGHVHNRQSPRPFLNVAVDLHGFRPLSETEVAELLGI